MKHFIPFFGRFIDYPSAIAGAVLMGLVVGWINADHGFLPALTAALKQGCYTFLFGGMLVKMLGMVVMKIEPKYLAIIFSTLAISILTIVLVYLLHSMKGTPKPFASTLPTIFFAPPGFFVLAWRKRRKTAIPRP